MRVRFLPESPEFTAGLMVSRESHKLLTASSSLAPATIDLNMLNQFKHAFKKTFDLGPVFCFVILFLILLLDIIDGDITFITIFVWTVLIAEFIFEFTHFEFDKDGK